MKNLVEILHCFRLEIISNLSQNSLTSLHLAQRYYFQELTQCFPFYTLSIDHNFIVS